MARLPSFKIARDPTRLNRFFVYYRGDKYYFASEREAEFQIDKWKRGAGRTMTPRQVDEYWHCMELLGGERLIDAVRWYVQHQPVGLKTMTVKDALVLYEPSFGKEMRPATKKEMGRALKMLRENFADEKLAAVTKTRACAFLDDCATPWQRFHYHAYLSRFFLWAKREGLVQVSPLEGVRKETPKGTKVVLSVDDAWLLVQVAREKFPQALAAVALQLFAGVRTEELERLTWPFVRRGAIRIESAIAKKHHRRVIDWWPAALDSCLPELPTTGRVVENFVEWKRALVAECRNRNPDFVWGQNAMRHSYASYACAFHQHPGKVSMWMGDRDIDTFFNNYREYVTEDSAKVYFSSSLPPGRV